MTDLQPTSFRCSNCGEQAMAGSGINCSALVIHIGELHHFRACSDAGGPFFVGVASKELEDLIRDANGLDFLRATS